MSLHIDHTSLLAEVPGEAKLDAVETELAAQGLTLGVVLPSGGPTVAEWLARGAPGAASVFADPADHVVAGLTLTLSGTGKRLDVRPSPRRAVGPDLLLLAVGAGGRFGRIERAWLRVHRRDAVRPCLALPGGDLDPPLSDAESRLLDAIEAELGRS
jgi:alkyldihydroxyacetonephosphate synthase